MSFKSFLSKHSGELANVATVLSAVVRALPIDRQDKSNLGRMISDLANAAKRIEKAASEMPADENAVPVSARAVAAKPKRPRVEGGKVSK